MTFPSSVGAEMNVQRRRPFRRPVQRLLAVCLSTPVRRAITLCPVTHAGLVFTPCD